MLLAPPEARRAPATSSFGRSGGPASAGALASGGTMPIEISNTPNPNALKFTVGVDVGGPATFVAGTAADDPMAAALLAIDGVTSVFMTADFVTVSKRPDASWDVIAAPAADLIEQRFAP